MEGFSARGLVDGAKVNKYATHRGVRANRSNFEKSIRKCDVPMIFPDDELQWRVEKECSLYLAPALTSTVLQAHDQIYIDSSTSPSSYWKRKGCKTKGEALKHPDFARAYFDVNEEVVCDYNPKYEALPSESIIVDNKVRGTFNPPVHSIVREKMLFENQNKQLKLFSREPEYPIKYGFVKQYGGFSRLGKIFEKYEYVETDDCSGWDRIAFLGRVYNLRIPYVGGIDNHLNTLYTCVSNVVWALVICPDGVVRARPTGNISGGNNTTADNCLAHFPILVRLFSKVWHRAFGYWPSIREIFTQVHFAIYSDDSVIGINLSFFNMGVDEYRSIKIETYLEFGLILKASQHARIVAFERLDNSIKFLGSGFQYYPFLDSYIPYPNEEKICSSLKYTLDTKTFTDVFARALALTIISAPVPWLFETAKSFLNFLSYRINWSETNMSLDWKKFAQEEKCDATFWIMWMLGRECGLLSFVGGRLEKEMTDRAAKAERSLAKTCAKLGITESGKRWLDLCLDPFKDLNMPTAGYPDSVTVPSVVQTIHDSYTVAVPASVASGANWDCNIFVDSLYNSVLVYNTPYDATQSAVLQATQGVTGYNRGGLVVRSAAAGTTLSTPTTTFGASLKQDILPQGDIRVIGLGLEIHNTTGELYKQGALVCYRVPDAPTETFAMNAMVDNGVTACVPRVDQALPLTSVPLTASAAIDLPGSLQWEAKDGAYIVPTLSSPTLPPESLELVPPFVSEGGNYYYPQLGQIGAAKRVIFGADTRNVEMGFSTSGVYLTGLSYQTTLQINMTYYVEVFPTKDSVLRRSVQPAPGLDAKALDLYAHIIAHMPVGVEVNDNFLGAFISGIANIARTVGGFLGRNAGTISRGAALVGEVASNIDYAERERRAAQINASARARNNPIVEVIEEVNSPAIRREMEREERAIIPYRQAPLVHRPMEVVTVSRNGNVRVSNVTTNRSGRQARTQKAREKKNRIIDNATKGYAGNRWIDNPKKK